MNGESNDAAAGCVDRWMRHTVALGYGPKCGVTRVVQIKVKGNVNDDSREINYALVLVVVVLQAVPLLDWATGVSQT